MTWHSSSERDIEAVVAHRSSRRVLIVNSVKVLGVGALVAAGALRTASVAAQDDGLGAGGRTGGDSAASASSLPAAQEQGLGAGGRQGGDDAGGGGRGRRRGADAPAGVGAGGRTHDPMVMEMPDTGVGIAEGGMAPILLAGGTVGAAAMALRLRETSVSPGT